MPDHTPLTAEELAEMRERCGEKHPYSDLARCLAEIDDLRGKLRQAIGLLEDAANWEEIGPLEVETQKEIAEFCKTIRFPPSDTQTGETR